jgi:hypothetical protein
VASGSCGVPRLWHRLLRRSASESGRLRQGDGDPRGQLLPEGASVDYRPSSGSACHAGSQDPSHVLLAIGRSAELAHTALRLTLGAPTTEAEIDHVVKALPRVATRARGGAPPRPASAVWAA